MKIYKKTGTILYAILWAGSLLILAAMLILGYRQKVAEKNLFSKVTAGFNSSSGSIINELFLTGEDISFGKKKSFINLLLKEQGTEEDFEAAVKTNPEKVYKIILQQKLNRIRQQKPEDFAVKPLPK